MAVGSGIIGVYLQEGEHMRNTWKGMIVGALTGAFVGFLMDLAKGAGEGAVAVGQKVHERLPDAAERVQQAAHTAAEKVRDADVGDRLRDVAQRVADSDAVARARNAAAHIGDR
jgi:hypothetical protein